MGASKRLFQDIEQKKDEARQLLEDMIENYDLDKLLLELYKLKSIL